MKSINNNSKKKLFSKNSHNFYFIKLKELFHRDKTMLKKKLEI